MLFDNNSNQVYFLCRPEMAGSCTILWYGGQWQYCGHWMVLPILYIH